MLDDSCETRSAAVFYCFSSSTFGCPFSSIHQIVQLRSKSPFFSNFQSSRPTPVLNPLYLLCHTHELQALPAGC